MTCFNLQNVVKVGSPEKNKGYSVKLEHQLHRKKWDILILKLLFICYSNLAGHPVFYLRKQATLGKYDDTTLGWYDNAIPVSGLAFKKPALWKSATML